MIYLGARISVPAPSWTSREFDTRLARLTVAWRGMSLKLVGRTRVRLWYPECMRGHSHG